MSKRLFRSKSDKILCGVCGGIGEYLGVDPNIIRLITVALFVINPLLIFILYIVACFILPEGYRSKELSEESLKSLDLRRILNEVAKSKYLRSVLLILSFVLVIIGLIAIVVSLLKPVITLTLWSQPLGFVLSLSYGIALIIAGIALVIIAQRLP